MEWTRGSVLSNLQDPNQEAFSLLPLELPRAADSAHPEPIAGGPPSIV